MLLTIKPMIFRSATTTDRPALIKLLHEVDLLTDDLPTDLTTFTLAFDAEKLAGAAGVEVVGSTGLLRSVAVSSVYRQHQLGRQLVDASLKLAADNGVTTLYLITTTAEGYFKRLGFSRVDRTNVPETIAQTRQFSDLCPASSVVMLKKI
jgi:amino-acid N-acetyltransferase